MKAGPTSEVRQRRGSSNAITAKTPTKPPSARLFYEESPIPGAKKKWNVETNSHDSNDSSDAGGSLPVDPVDTNTGKAMSGEQVKKDESKLKKIMVRVVFGACMFCVFAGSVRMMLLRNGHCTSLIPGAWIFLLTCGTL